MKKFPGFKELNCNCLYTCSNPFPTESSADNLCKQFGPRFWPESGSNLFDTQMVFLKEFLEKVESEKYQQTSKTMYCILAVICTR